MQQGLTGRVLDPEGKPVAGAKVFLGYHIPYSPELAPALTVCGPRPATTVDSSSAPPGHHWGSRKETRSGATRRLLPSLTPTAPPGKTGSCDSQGLRATVFFRNIVADRAGSHWTFLVAALRA